MLYSGVIKNLQPLSSNLLSHVKSFYNFESPVNYVYNIWHMCNKPLLENANIIVVSKNLIWNVY